MFGESPSYVPETDTQPSITGPLPELPTDLKKLDIGSPSITGPLPELPTDLKKLDIDEEAQITAIADGIENNDGETRSRKDILAQARQEYADRKAQG